MKITIWGARGSTPSPLKPEDIREKIFQAMMGAKGVDITNPKAVRAYVNKLPPLVGGTAGGNTPCIEVNCDQETIIIDAGSGLRDLGLKLMEGPCGRGEGVLHMLFSHAHWDHIQGFPFFRPAFIPGNKIFIYSIHDIETVLTDQQRFINFPVPLSYMQASMEFRPFPLESELIIGDATIRAIKNFHPNDAYSFRFEHHDSVFVHASDAEYKQLKEASLRPYLNFFRNADVLIFDAQFSLKEALDKVDWGHSSALIGADIARRASVKTLVLFHHDPTYSDEALQNIQNATVEYQAQDTTLPICKVVVAYEGLTFDLEKSETTHLEYISGGHITVLTPPKIIDGQSVEVLEQQLADLQETGWPARLIIDLSQVEKLTMAGLKALISLHREQEGTSLMLAGPSKRIQKVIELAGFSDFFAIYPSAQEAINILRMRDSLELKGQLIKNQYQIEDKIGKGLLGTVFKATDQHNNHTVAVKVLSASFSQKAINQFLSQARQLIKLDHPNIVKVFDCDEEHGLSFIAEEYLDAETLRDIIEALAQSPFPADKAFTIGLEIAQALDHAHNQGVIHGDLKPKNVLLVDKVKITDFGLGHLEEGHHLLTAPLVMLTAQYLAPEQIMGQTIDAKTDLYAFGVILYELFTGHPPFTGTDQQIMEAHLHQTPAPPRQLNPQISHTAEALILKLLAKDPNDRCESAQQAYSILSGLVAKTETRNGKSVPANNIQNI